MRRIAALVALPVVLCSCGSGSPATLPSTLQRAAIVAAAKTALRFPAQQHIHVDVLSVRLAASDPHFASAAVQPKDAHGHATTDVGVVVLMQAGGKWTIVLGPGTSFEPMCALPTPKPIRQLLCPDPYKVLGI